ncbi:hypothetical protein QUF76_02705 [Desulfobacterales bacterium HSG16]|nr:hypothetical protein [Desulfobacterales bacterium HSG16]
MGQCKTTLDTGKQCSNRTVPGKDYCSKHKPRIKFHRITDKTPAAAPSKSGGGEKKPPDYKAEPKDGNAKPAFPGLQTDKRNILIAPVGIIWLRQTDKKDETGNISGRLIRVISCLNRETSLAGLVTVFSAEKNGIIIRINPNNPSTDDLSRFYDTALAAAELSDGLFYIGKERIFIRYRDGNAPGGYDADNVDIPDSKDIFLIDIDGTHVIQEKSLAEKPLDKLLLSFSPRPERGTEIPETIYALCRPALYSMLAEYFRNHDFLYDVARFCTPEKSTLVLFKIFPRHDAPIGSIIPGFMLTWLAGLPWCAVLQESEIEEGRTMLVEYGYRYPCRRIADVFPQESLLIFTSNPDFSNMCLIPCPTFFDGDELIKSTDSCNAAEYEITPVNDSSRVSLKVPVRLIPASGPSPFPSALILDNRETSWLCRLIRCLPELPFHRFFMCQGKESSVLMSRENHIEGIPFGIPLCSVKDTNLFVPVQSRLTPELPWAVLSEVMGISKNTYSFMTKDFRLDVPEKNFSPLSRALVAESKELRSDLKIEPASELPNLKWTGPTQKKGKSGNRKGLFQKLSEKATGASNKENPANREAAFQQEAEKCRGKGDFLGAGVCFAMIDDSANAARCFKKAAER